MPTAIVTGCAGFIGSHLAEALLEEGWTVHGIDNFHPYYSEALKRHNVREIRGTAGTVSGTFSFVEGSILEDEDLAQLPENPEYVFHQAAVAGVRSSVENPVEYKRQNVLGTAKLLDAIVPTEKFVFASSSSLYGDVSEEELPVKETDDGHDPIAPYPLSKMQAEEIVLLFSDLYDIPSVITRFFSVYGPRQRPDEAFTKFIAKALNGETIPIYGDGEQTRDFTHVNDIVDGTIRAAQHGENGEIYNLGSQRRVSVNTMVDVLEQVMDKPIQREYVDQPAGDVRHTHAHIGKAREDIGYEPGISFEDGAKSCVQWCKRVQEKGLL